MKKRVKSFIGMFVLISSLSIPLVALGNSYSSYISGLYNQITGATRYYDGSNIMISMDSSSTGGYSDYGTYTVTLMRDNTWNDDYIGAVNVPRNGYGEGKWSSVGSGNYYFIFSKTIDNYLVDANPVYMENY